ncbi:MAG: flagellar type III secretion system pore protein FliP [Eubacteriales bacterium]|nr:flagellar type III secretion system pore protein FliP [Eubacteriales bacterium]MDD4683504.1 flagellar type III secretion system pore protein FliP [Eubacteriales bacterium]
MLISGSGVQAQITLPDDRSSTLQLLLMLTILSLLPSILIMMTSFTRIIIVLSFVRNALGTQNTPPNQVLIGLSMFLTFFFMAPVFDEINTNAYQPYVSGQMEQDEAIDEAMKPLRNFMGKQTNTTDLEMFMEMSGIPSVESFDDIPSSVLIPAFMTSELKQAFQLGFFIFIPFLVIDMIVASTLMSMGMMMLPPTVISLPFKILLFVLVDGWDLVIKTLFNSFN